MLFPHHPRPQLQRAGWMSLDSPWRFCIDNEEAFEGPESEFTWTHSIEVPFPPESSASGVGENGLNRVFWYQREVEIGPPAGGERIFLHFGAVDYQASVWVNGRLAALHEGGHTPFHADITGLLRPEGPKRSWRAPDGAQPAPRTCEPAGPCGSPEPFAHGRAGEAAGAG